jgi:hypothetical protein
MSTSAKVEATLASTIAELSFEDFSSFVESLGSRMAKKVSKTLAHTVLDRFVHNEQQADAEDRKRCVINSACHKGC